MNEIKDKITGKNLNLSKLPEKVYKEFYSKVDILYFLINNTYQVESCNVVVQEKLGYSDVEILGKKFTDFFNKNDIDEIQESLEQCFKKGYIRDVRTNILGENGSFPITINGLSQLDDSGNPKFIRLFIQDITELYRLQKERDFSNNVVNKIIKYDVSFSDLKDILNNIHTILNFWEIGIVIDRQSTENIFLKISSNNNQLYQNKKDEYIFWDYNIWHKVINSCPEVSSASVDSKGVSLIGKLSDFVLGIKSEELKDYLVSLTEYESLIIVPISEENNFNGYLIILGKKQEMWNDRDVDFLEKNAAIIEKSISLNINKAPQSNDITQSINNSPLLGILCIKNEKIEFVNEWVCEILGITQKNLKGRKIFDFLSPESIEEIKKLQDTDNSKNICDITVLTADSSRCEIKCSITKITHENVHSQLWYWINQSDERRLKDQLIQARKMESLGILTGGIVHDFNNHLASILGFSSLLKEEVPKNNQFYDDIIQIADSAEKASDLAERLSAYSKGSSYIVNSLDVNQLIREVATILSRTLENNKSIHAELSPDLYPVRADASQIQQAILQVALNSRDAIPEGGKIFFKTRNIILKDINVCKMYNAKPGKYVQIEISDNGYGISSELKSKIFDPDFTTKNVDTKKGMGLAMVQNVIQKHSGFISVFSEKNRGTVFKIHLSAQKKKIEDKESAADIKPSLGKETILLVDSEEIIRETARKMLNRYGYKIISAGNSSEAIAIYKKYKNRIDLIILDITLSGMSIKKVLAWFNKIKPGVKIIATSRKGENEKLENVYKRKVTGFIEKPFEIRPLLSKIRSCISE
ncbi:MAG: PAS domain S-box protein [bacterium]